MSCTLTPHSFESLTSLWQDPRHRLRWDPVFVLPCWLEAWWRAFGAGAENYLCDVREGDDVIGIAPLLVRDCRASFIGSTDVCDYLDFIVAPGKERPFFTFLLDQMRRDGVGELYLESLRPDSTALTRLVGIARDEGYSVLSTLENVSLHLDLPATWEGLLHILTPKQRREIGRKLRRLEEAGKVEFETVEGPGAVQETMHVFLRLLRESREDKAAFMTAQMEAFFRSVAESMAQAGLLRFGILRIDAQPIAAVMCFDYNGQVYLYNSGYSPGHAHLSAGLLSKVLSVKDSIERRRKRYDFLKGAEEYKYRLGGTEIPIYNCRIVLA